MRARQEFVAIESTFGEPIPPQAVKMDVYSASVLDEVEAMSQENRADTPAERRGRYNSPPWLVALASILRRGGALNAIPTIRWVLPTYDGDRPADLTDEQIRIAATYVPEFRNRCRENDQFATLVREAILDRGRGDGYAAGVRETHRAVHQALADEPCPTCQWCNPPTKSTPVP